MAAASPGADLPLQTTGARRRVAPAAATTAAPSTGARPGAFAGLERALGLGASRTRKLAWLTMTCAGSHGTLTMLSAGWSSNPDVLVSTLI